MNSKTEDGAKTDTFRGLVITSVQKTTEKTTEKGQDSSPGRGGWYPQIMLEKSVWMDRPQACLQTGFEGRCWQDTERVGS